MKEELVHGGGREVPAGSNHGEMAERWRDKTAPRDGRRGGCELETEKYR